MSQFYRGHFDDRQEQYPAFRHRHRRKHSLLYKAARAGAGSGQPDIWYVHFAFWSWPGPLEKNGVEPAPTAAGGAADLGFRVNEPGMVDSMYVDWKAKGASILMLPTDLDFGRSFVAADPDGHRLRVYTVDDE